MSSFRPELTPEVFNDRSAGHLPGLVGLRILTITPQGVESRLEVRREVMAPNGFLHAATVIALADTSCGYGCVALLPQGASGFTTLELKANFVGTTREGAIACRATPVHLGRTVGRGGDHRGHGPEDRAVPLHPDGPLSQVDRAGPAVLQSIP
jgi:1,4-dihydroxy-2-naphthoyl-CoA hydrolase